MRFSTKLLLSVGLLATVIAVGFWLARVFIQATVVVTEQSPEAGTESTLVKTELPRSAAKHRPPEPPEPAAGRNPMEVAATGTNLITDWENRIDDALRLDVEPAEVGQKLMEMLPQLPQDGRVEALQHAVNLVPDVAYGQLGKMLTDPKTSEDEIEILMRDVLNRANSIKLPLLLEIARTSGHVKAGEAREILEVFLGENYESDWAKWQAKVDEFMKENPEEVGSSDP